MEDLSLEMVSRNVMNAKATIGNFLQALNVLIPGWNDLWGVNDYYW